MPDARRLTYRLGRDDGAEQYLSLDRDGEGKGSSEGKTKGVGHYMHERVHDSHGRSIGAGGMGLLVSRVLRILWVKYYGIIQKLTQLGQSPTDESKLAKLKEVCKYSSLYQLWLTISLIADRTYAEIVTTCKRYERAAACQFYCWKSTHSLGEGSGVILLKIRKRERDIQQVIVG